MLTNCHCKHRYCCTVSQSFQPMIVLTYCNAIDWLLNVCLVLWLGIECMPCVMIGYWKYAMYDDWLLKVCLVLWLAIKSMPCIIFGYCNETILIVKYKLLIGEINIYVKLRCNNNFFCLSANHSQGRVPLAEVKWVRSTRVKVKFDRPLVHPSICSSSKASLQNW